eukprot:664712-Pleurochrysis_carterae.AAC.1
MHVRLCVAVQQLHMQREGECTTMHMQRPGAARINVTLGVVLGAVLRHLGVRLPQLLDERLPSVDRQVSLDLRRLIVLSPQQRRALSVIVRDPARSPASCTFHRASQLQDVAVDLAPGPALLRRTAQREGLKEQVHRKSRSSSPAAILLSNNKKAPEGLAHLRIVLVENASQCVTIASAFVGVGLGLRTKLLAVVAKRDDVDAITGETAF